MICTLDTLIQPLTLATQQGHAALLKATAMRPTWLCSVHTNINVKSKPYSHHIVFITYISLDCNVISFRVNVVRFVELTQQRTLSSPVAWGHTVKSSRWQHLRWRYWLGWRALFQLQGFMWWQWNDTDTNIGCCWTDFGDKKIGQKTTKLIIGCIFSIFSTSSVKQNTEY